MRRWIIGLVGSFSVLALGLAATAVQAGVVIRLAQPDRLPLSQLVVIGTVSSIEEQDMPLALAPKANALVNHKVAVVKVNDTIKGNERNMTIRVAFLPPPMIRKGPKLPFIRNPELKEGQEVLLYVKKHFKEPVYLATNNLSFVVKDTGPRFTNEVEQAKYKVKLLQRPLENLRSKDAKDRLQTAALLLSAYRGTVSAKTEPINADESKLILEALQNANWQTGMQDPLGGRFLFNQLEVTARDGWTPPKDFQKFNAAAQEWLRQNAATFRIQRFVPEMAAQRGN